MIPIGEEVLYAQPLYLQATGGANAATELKFVILATNDGVVMRSTLPEAIDAVRAGNLERTAVVVDDAETAEGDDRSVEIDTTSLAEQAVDAFDRSQDALARGDWAAYGEAQAELGAIIEQLAGEASADDEIANPDEVATPAP